MDKVNLWLMKFASIALVRESVRYSAYCVRTFWNWIWNFINSATWGTTAVITLVFETNYSKKYTENVRREVSKCIYSVKGIIRILKFNNELTV